MQSPFPGMDPYLEHPGIWHPVHTRLVTGLADAIDPVLPDRYYVSVEERAIVAVPGDTLAVGHPDVVVADLGSHPGAAAGATATLSRAVPILVPSPEPVRERYLEIRDLEAREEVVTVIEVLSHSNKRPGRDRDEYLEKRGSVLSSRTSLVEIDLLRAGHRMPSSGAPEQYDYGTTISRGHDRPRAELLPFSVRDPVPVLPIPLWPGEPEPVVDLESVVAEVYRRGRYARRLDYHRPPEPPFPPEDDQWAETLLQAAGLR